ncbi:uncharacterized protein EI90DRAFT_523734 [Cantharellus anzutake]|uniref:uncharacterized protein n=1 Tax=Cantharellus anzutake TaxID=1750568 RepID=UPI0019032553|nr:uncharacterized protein EI90DRAFT_523734 [Cantharellus anzutake]KAF8334204.1 hypothetical protein EI90DRAFT_523734 [Cantharellus anzutake]
MHIFPPKLGTGSNPSPALPIEQHLDAPSFAARLLDISPPSSRMSALTSDSDYGAPVDKGKWREITKPSYDYTSNNVHALNDYHDAQEWLSDELKQPLITENKRSPKNMHKPPPLHISVTSSDSSDREHSSSSASGFLDPYYFSIPSPAESSPVSLHPETSETPRYQWQQSSKRGCLIEPKTPGRDPAAIDRTHLVGVGELTTPRWAKTRDPGWDDARGSAVSSPSQYDSNNESLLMRSWVVNEIEAPNDEGDHVLAVSYLLFYWLFLH